MEKFFEFDCFSFREEFILINELIRIKILLKIIENLMNLN